MANVLGLSFFYHDSAASLVCGGEIIAAVAEERLCRRKHSNEFPKLAVEYCLEQADLRSINDLDAIVFYEKPLVKFVRVLETFVATWPKSYLPFVQSFPTFLQSKTNIRKVIHDHYPSYNGDILFNEHHLSHAASAFFPSPYEEAAILSIDGVGEWDTTCIGYGNGNHLQLDKELHFPHSVGLLYSALTGYLGFRVNDGEWKVMGLAPYGEPRYVDQFRELVHICDDGSFALNMLYFSHHWSNKYPYRHKRWEKLFGFPSRPKGDEISQEYKDLARSGQAVVEELILGIARQAKQLYQTENVVIAGGVGLNSVANWKIEQQEVFKNVWIQPAAGDDGGSLGAALYVSHKLYDDKRQPMDHVYFGPEYADSEILGFLDERDLEYVQLAGADLIENAADCIAEGQVIGWFQGRSEFGPRALGNRSILADATNADMKATINAKIKFREFFRPFAPAVPLENVHEYFEVAAGTELPFMLKIPKVRDEVKDKLPAITHEDGTGRVQTIRRDVNQRYHQLLCAVQKRTGVPVVVNTSFNVRGEPIVCSPQDAYNCFQKTGIDTLFLGPFMITKSADVAQDYDQAYRESDALELTIGDEISAGPDIGGVVERVNGTIIDTNDPRKVLEFYKTLPFNFYSSATDAYATLLRRNQIKDYPNLHAVLKNGQELDVLDVGCGAGWFVNSCANYYPHRVMGIDFNPIAVRQAKAVARFAKSPDNINMKVADIFEFEPPRHFDVVNSIGVLHHTRDCHGAIRRICSWLQPGDFFHVGLYHSYSRRPFLDHFKRMQERGASVNEMFDEFRSLKFGLSDDVNLYSWFRDQVIHPHETQHSFEEIADLLEQQGLNVCSTSINKFKRLPDRQSLIKLEKALEAYSQRRLKQGHYLPGFFTLLAVKK